MLFEFMEHYFFELSLSLQSYLIYSTESIVFYFKKMFVLR